MIIQVLANLRDEGYLERGRHPTVAPFFAGANVAFRREALDQVGGFDPACETGEDCDICARIALADWDMYLHPGATVSHGNPSKLSQLVRQWFRYGLYHPYVFAKHNESALEFYVRLGRTAGGQRHGCLFYRRLPVGVVVFVTTFLLLHLCLLLTLVAGVLGCAPAAWAAGGAAAVLAALYAWPDVSRHGLLRGAAFTLIRYAADMALFVGALIGGLRQRMLYLSATID